MKNEHRAAQALWELRKDPRRFGLRYGIKKVVHARPNSDLDQARVDLLAVLTSGVAIPIQIKSCKEAARKHIRKCHKFGKYIPCLVVENGESIVSLMKKCAELINSVYEHFVSFSKAWIERTHVSAHQWYRTCHRYHRCYRPQMYAMVH